MIAAPASKGCHRAVHQHCILSMIVPATRSAGPIELADDGQPGSRVQRVAPPPRFTVTNVHRRVHHRRTLVMVAVSVEPGVPAGVQFVAVNQLLETAPFQM